MGLNVKRPSSWIGCVACGATALAVLAVSVGMSVFSYTHGSGREDIIAFLIAGLVLFLIITAAGTWALWGRVFPRTLAIKKGKLQYFVGGRLVGQIPLANLKSAAVIYKTVRRNPAIGALGGALGAILTSGLAEEVEVPVGIRLTLRKRSDSDTYWPESMFEDGREIAIHYQWSLGHEEIVKKIRPEIAKHYYDER